MKNIKIQKMDSVMKLKMRLVSRVGFMLGEKEQKWIKRNRRVNIQKQRLTLESREIVIEIARSIVNKAMEKESELEKMKQEEIKLAREQD